MKWPEVLLDRLEEGWGRGGCNRGQVLNEYGDAQDRRVMEGFCGRVSNEGSGALHVAFRKASCPGLRYEQRPGG